MTVRRRGRRSDPIDPCRWWAVASIVSVLLVAGCTNSKFIISPLYNRLDNTLRSQFTDLAEFDEEQLAAADVLIGTFHVWHRQNELTAYAALLDEVRTTIGRSGPSDGVTAKTIQAWFADAQALGDQVRQCHPINFSAELIASMSDSQISDMHRSILAERAEDRAEYGKRSAKERLERRAERFAKWAGRIGVTLNEQQKRLVNTMLEQQISMRKQYGASSDVWLQTLFNLFDERRDSDFKPRLRQHMQGFGTWLQQDYPEQWQRNREVWRSFALQFVESLTSAQRRAADDWMRKMADTLRAIAADKPSFQVSNRPADGCGTEEPAPEEGV